MLRAVCCKIKNMHKINNCALWIIVHHNIQNVDVNQSIMCTHLFETDVMV